LTKASSFGSVLGAGLVLLLAPRARSRSQANTRRFREFLRDATTDSMARHAGVSSPSRTRLVAKGEGVRNDVADAIGVARAKWNASRSA
jgi:hypothetical protein